MTWDPDSSEPLARLLELVARLRGPDGCPWDRAQRLADIRAYLLEEAHELADAIDRKAWPEIAAELGDLLFHVAFVGRLAEEAEAFTLTEVAAGIERKMIERHPHVFGDLELESPADVRRFWEERKVRQREGRESLLQGVARSLPALVAAYRMTQKAAGVGFDWAEPSAVFGKLGEEIGELEAALATAQEAPDGGPDPAVVEEIGDLLFTVANLARKLEIDPEAALAAANRKFRRRFESIESALAENGRNLADATLEEMDLLWQAAKAAESP